MTSIKKRTSFAPAITIIFFMGLIYVIGEKGPVPAVLAPGSRECI
jgi:hypothetical protein